MKKYLVSALFVANGLLVTAHAQESTAANSAVDATNADTRFITDNLFIYRHAGPGTNYRILGSFAAGTKVELLNTSDNGSYVELIDDNGRTGWVETKFVTEQASVRLQIPQLQEQILDAREQVIVRENEITELQQELATLKQQNATLNETIADLQRIETSLQRQNTQLNEDDSLNWYLKGGGMTLGAIILGILLTYLPKKRKRNDQWM